jgi:hypothetical protein
MKLRLKRQQMLMRYSHSKHKQSNIPTLTNKWEFTMQEYKPQQSYDQSPQRVGDTLENGADIGFRVGEIAKREQSIASALADVDSAMQSATQPLAESAREYAMNAEKHRLEQIKAVGQSASAVVYGLRKPQSDANEERIDIFNDSVSTPLYLDSAEKKDFDLTA